MGKVLYSLIAGFLLICLCLPTSSHAIVGFYCFLDKVQLALVDIRMKRSLREPDQRQVVLKEVKRLKALPKRDLNNDPPSLEFLKNNKIYISLTTSPERIGQISNVIRTLDLTHVEEVIVAIPKKFGRNGKEYVVPQELLSMPKVKLLRPEKDLGPATKLLPAVEYARAIYPQSRVITIDDDIGYPNGMINDLIYFSARLPDAVLGASGANVGFWGIPANFTHSKPKLNLKRAETATSTDVIEGFGAVSYPVSKVDTDLIKKWAFKCNECLVSDDLTISMSLQKNRTPRYRIRSPYYNKGSLVTFGYGYQGDALHKGGGLRETDSTNAAPTSDVNQHKYQITYDAIRKELQGTDR
jgi:hypothetical protein